MGEAIVRAYCRGPHYRGKIHVARWLAGWLLPTEGGIYSLADGTRLYLHPRDWIEYRLMQRGNYEPITLEFLAKQLREGQSAVLAGVNIGLHVIVASRSVGQSGHVVGIEPQPASLMRSRDNISLNDLADNITLVAAAIGSEASLAPMAPAPVQNTGSASLVAMDPGRYPFHVVTETLPEILYRLKLRRPDLMLLDVEGYELEVLRGITTSSRPKILIIEVKDEHLERAGTTSKALVARLGELGYRCHDLHGQEYREGASIDEFNLVAVTEDAGPVRWV